jgi:signal transduction histidine kinase
MSLSARLSAFFLAALGVVLVGFSTALYVSARVYLHRQVGDRLDAALAVLAAAAEIHVEGVEWEPQERELPLGQESGPDRLRWMVHDDRGRRVDHSRNLADANLTPAWTPRAASAELPARLGDRQGRTWRVAQRRLRPGPTGPASGSRAVERGDESHDLDPPGVLYPSLVLTVCAPIDPMEATLATLAWLLAALTLGVWMIAALLGRWLSRRALAPLTSMVESARGLDATDAGWFLTEAGTGDELDDLGRAFNELLARLHAAYERQRRFSADASHQLRTPLTALIGQIEVALRRERPGEEYRRVLHLLHHRAVHLGQIVEALLFLGRADADAGLTESETLDLRGWVAEYLAARPAPGCSAPIARDDPDVGPLWVRAHPALLGQLLDNLLDNARKYGPPGAPVVVRTRRAGGFATLAVEDAGPGIDSHDLPRLFEPFYRSERARRLGLPGVGLGLAVAERIAVAFGGSIGVRSEPGRGSCFEVRLPEAAPPSRPIAQADALERVAARNGTGPGRV